MPSTEASKTVLVVDDNPVEREGLAAVLQQEGYNTMTAADGKEALDRLRGDPSPDLLLLDMLMSEHDGWQLLRLLRKTPALAPIPVVIITGLDIASPEWASSLGAAGLLHKPIDAEELHREVERWLR